MVFINIGRIEIYIAGVSSSWRCLRPACRGRLKIDVNDEIISSSHHNDAPEPEVEKAEELRQITTSESNANNHAGKWVLIEPREVEKIMAR